MKTLSLHILDIIQNSVRAEADTIKLIINESEKNNTYFIQFVDNGCGMDKEMLNTVLDPFTTSRKTRKVGLGLSLFKLNAERAGGTLTIESKVGEGTVVNVNFECNNIDRLPMGDLPEVLVQLFASYENINFEYSHKTDMGEYSISTADISEALDGVSLSDPNIIGYIREMISENLGEIKIS